MVPHSPPDPSLWSEQLRKLESNLTKTAEFHYEICWWFVGDHNVEGYRFQSILWRLLTYISHKHICGVYWLVVTIYGQDLQPKHLAIVRTTTCWFTYTSVTSRHELLDILMVPVFTIWVKVLGNSELFIEEQCCLVSIHSGMVILNYSHY